MLNIGRDTVYYGDSINHSLKNWALGLVIQKVDKNICHPQDLNNFVVDISAGA